MSQTLRPFRPISPGEILKEEIEARGWTQSDLAEILGRPVQAINEIIAGKKAIVATTANELARALGTNPEYWLNLESAYRLDLLHQADGNAGSGGAAPAGRVGDQIARRARVYSLVPVKDLQKKGWITRTKELDVIEREVCALLEIPSLNKQPNLNLAARKSDSYGQFTPAQIAWACRARQHARKQKVGPFDRRQFNTQVAGLPQRSTAKDGPQQTIDALARLGIRVVIVEALPQSRIDGACLWLDEESPVVALSLRYDRIDYFWFTLMHELAHLKQTTARTAHLDHDLVGPSARSPEDKPAEEQEADALAGEWLLPQAEMKRFIARTKPYYSKKSILDFAAQIGVHPGIVVGRLQYLREISYSHSRGMLGKVRGALTQTDR